MVWVQIRLGAFCSSCIKKFITRKRSFLYCNLDAGSCPLVSAAKRCPAGSQPCPRIFLSASITGYRVAKHDHHQIQMNTPCPRKSTCPPDARGANYVRGFFSGCSLQHLALNSPLVTLRVYSDFPRHGWSFWWRPQFLCKFCGLQCAVQQGRAHGRFAAVPSSKYQGFCRPFVLLCDWWRFN